MCVLMAFVIDSVERECYIYKDIRCGGIYSELPCSTESAIAKTGIPLHTHTRSNTLKSSWTLLIFVMGINFCR